MDRFSSGNGNGFRSGIEIRRASVDGSGESDIRLAGGIVTNDSVSPCTYAPRYRSVLRSSPRAAFSLSPRFDARKSGFISQYHNSNLLCTASPGPKYAYSSDKTLKRAPAYSMSWGDRKTRQQLLAEQASVLEQKAEVGPSSYTPRYRTVKRTAPASSFGQARRFQRHETAGDLTVEEDMLHRDASDETTIHRNHSNLVRRKAPSHSFPRQGSQFQTRTWFLNHNVRGQLAHAATMDGAIGPGRYKPQKQRKKVAGGSFGKSSRFAKPGTEYISAQHCQNNVGVSSPGPKYSSTLYDTAQKRKTARVSSWDWIA